MKTFTDQCSGSEFVARNAKLEVYPTKSGHLAFAGTTDERGYISDEAAAFLEEEMAKPEATLKAAISQLSFSVIHTEDADIPTLHMTPERPAAKWSY